MSDSTSDEDEGNVQGDVTSRSSDLTSESMIEEDENQGDETLRSSGLTSESMIEDKEDGGSGSRVTKEENTDNLVDTSLSTIEEDSQDMEEEGYFLDSAQEDKDERYHLYDACEEGNLLDVKRLLPDVDDINWVCGEDFETEISDQSICNPGFLHVASAKGHTSVVNYLIKMGADPNIQDGTGRTPLSFAANDEIVNALVSTECVIIDEGDSLNRTPLQYACLNGRFGVAGALISAGADVQRIDDEGNSLLHFTALGGNINLFKYLLNECKLPLESQSSDGQSVLHKACFQGRWEIIKFVIGKKLPSLSLTALDKNQTSSMKILKDTILNKYRINRRRHYCLSCLDEHNFTNGITEMKEKSNDINLSLNEAETVESLPDDEPIQDEIFLQALQEGSGLFQFAVVVMNGPPGAGKTSVKQLLLGRPCLLLKDQNSTGVLERPIRTCCMRIDAGGDLQLQEVDREEFHSFLLSSVHTKCTDSSVVTKMNPSSSSLPGPSGSIDPGKAESLPRGATNTIRPTTVKATRAFDSNETLRILKKKMMSAKSSRELFDVSWVYFVDSGGQPQFVDVLPRIVQSEALYLVVINLNQDLNAKQKSCYHLNGEEYTLPDTLALSNKELIERTCQIAESSKDCKMVLVVGTRLDKVNTDQIDKINQELLKLHKKYEKVLVPADDIVNNKFVLPVNAMAEGEERIKYRKMLQTCLLSVIDRIVTRKEVPVKWFIYQMDINEKAMSSGGVVAKSECNEIGKMLEMSDDEVESSLKFFNKLAVHLYSNASNFPPKVIVQMDPLVERLSCLIRSSFQPPKHFPTYMFSLLRLCGLFYQSIFLKIFSDITDNALSNEEFLKYLSIFKSWPNMKKITSFHVPCQLEK